MFRRKKKILDPNAAPSVEKKKRKNKNSNSQENEDLFGGGASVPYDDDSVVVPMGRKV
jgi:hypothetical protein